MFNFIIFSSLVWQVLKVNLLKEIWYGSRHMFEKTVYPWQPHSTFLSLFSPIHISIKFVPVFPCCRCYLAHNSSLAEFWKLWQLFCTPLQAQAQHIPLSSTYLHSLDILMPFITSPSTWSISLFLRLTQLDYLRNFIIYFTFMRWCNISFLTNPAYPARGPIFIQFFRFHSPSS